MQSVHLVVKEPPNPQVKKSIGVFRQSPQLMKMIELALQDDFPIISKKTQDTLKQEITNLLTTTDILAISRDHQGLVTVYFQDRELRGPIADKMKEET